MTEPEDLHTDDVQHHLREVQELLVRQKVVEGLVHRQDMPRHALVENLVHKQHEAALRAKLESLHSADIAYVLEALPLDERLYVWDLVKAERDGEILLEVSDAVRESLIASMDSEELVAAAETLEAEVCISAVGITANTDGIGLEALGVNMDRGHITIDGHCQTNVKGLYAIGDCAGAPWLAHKASHEGVMVAELIAGGHPHPIKPNSISGCTYCHPQVASVGLTEAKAKESGREIKVGRFPFVGNGKAIALGEPEGLVKTIFDAKTGELLGAHMVGAEVTELIQGYVIGKTLETTEAELMHTVFPHPTISESMHESVLAAYGRAIHI